MSFLFGKKKSYEELKLIAPEKKRTMSDSDVKKTPPMPRKSFFEILGLKGEETKPVVTTKVPTKNYGSNR